MVWHKCTKNFSLYSRYPTFLNLTKIEFPNKKTSLLNIKYNHLLSVTDRKSYSDQAATDPVQVFSKYGTDMQFETIRKFIEEETNVPTPEKWKELRSLVLSIQGTYAIEKLYQ